MPLTASQPFIFTGCVEVRQALDHRATDERELAERLAVVNPFEFASLEHLREELASIIHDHLRRLSAVPRVEFGEPFYFQQSHIVEVSLGAGANTLAEFRAGLASVDASAIYFHMVEARARLGRRAGDFAEWIRIDDYRRVAPPGVVDIILTLAERVRGRRFLHLSGGRFGSGPAEILQTLVPMMSDLGIDAAWEITGGDPGFYATAATLQAALRGSERVLTDEALDHFIEMNRVNAKKLALDADLVLVHDVQPATLVEHRASRGRWVWACHFDASRPQRRAWTFFRPFVNQYDAAVFALPSFSRRLGVPKYVIHPSIDPLSEKNRELAQSDPDVLVRELPPDASLQINALQRAATIVLQKSVRESFGLGAAEAMWKGKPVIGGFVGGLPQQIVYDVTGYLVSSVEGAAFRLRHLLNAPELIARMGAAGREHVRRSFLITRHLVDYMALLIHLTR